MQNLQLQKHSFQNFKVDHMTLLVQPDFYPVAYVLFRIIFGVTPSDILYNKTKEWTPGAGEKSMTFAAMVGNQLQESKEIDKTIIAVVQPTEPSSQSSHVRAMLQEHSAAAHWQHIALRTPDLMSFHKHAEDRAVNFITPVLKDPDEDLIQVFTGEWFFPGCGPSALFFEFVQRNPSANVIKKLEERNRESWFQDETFLGLYGEKETEYQRKSVTPFIDFELFDRIKKLIAGKEVFDINDQLVVKIEQLMMDYAVERREKN